VHVFAVYGIALTDRKQLEIDHLVPRSAGGATTS
jgi:hypothetical protein